MGVELVADFFVHKLQAGTPKFRPTNSTLLEGPQVNDPWALPLARGLMEGSGPPSLARIWRSGSPQGPHIAQKSPMLPPTFGT